MEKIDDLVYPFSNENMAYFRRLYNFEGANVLTVLSSGDQYFTSVLNGANDVAVFDTNPYTWPHFVLKFMALKFLNYEDFFAFFVISHLRSTEFYPRFRDFLPSDIQKLLDQYAADFSVLVEYASLYQGPKEKNDGSIIPYFNIANYYRLQHALQKRELPKFYNANILDLVKLDTSSFDLALFSNIYRFLNMNPKGYIEFLQQLGIPTVQAYYTWYWNKDKKAQELVSSGFIRTNVPYVEMQFYGNIYNDAFTYKRIK